jgi:hypothetical protein
MEIIRKVIYNFKIIKILCSCSPQNDDNFLFLFKINHSFPILKDDEDVLDLSITLEFSPKEQIYFKSLFHIMLNSRN